VPEAGPDYVWGTWGSPTDRRARAGHAWCELADGTIVDLTAGQWHFPGSPINATVEDLLIVPAGPEYDRLRAWWQEEERNRLNRKLFDDSRVRRSRCAASPEHGAHLHVRPGRHHEPLDEHGRPVPERLRVERYSVGVSRRTGSRAVRPTHWNSYSHGPSTDDQHVSEGRAARPPPNRR
jgi:hypothetical protein